MRTMKLVLVSMLVICALALAGPAFAEGSNEEPPTIGPNQIHHTDTVLPAFQERGTSGAGALAFTGADLMLFALGGAGAVGLGILVIRASRTARVEA